MEAVEELPAHNLHHDGKENVSVGVEGLNTELVVDCIKTNGLSELSTQEAVSACDVGETTTYVQLNSVPTCADDSIAIESNASITSDNNEEGKTDSVPESFNSSEPAFPDQIASCENSLQIESSTVESGLIETEVIIDDIHDGENVKFVTEVLVEAQEVTPYAGNDNNDENESDNKLLIELENHNMDMSEALISNVSEINENNNSMTRQEVYNKEDLLDILEGNDNVDAGNSSVDVSKKPMSYESQIALQQLSKLKKQSKSRKKSINAKKVSIKGSTNIKYYTEVPVEVNVVEIGSSEEPNSVSNLVKDWEDDETLDEKNENILTDETEHLLDSSNDLVNQQKDLAHDEECIAADSTCTPTPNDNGTPASAEGQRQRRLSRVIKKKVIFDPDNPDTFTKGKVAVKVKETEKQPLAKKIKIEPVTSVANTKSPVAKMQWKKPNPSKNIKQHKRLSEVDKLLMDEGAVKMLNQLTPDNLKGKKNVRNKSEFIKKINQSSTPDGNDMKFRERKKDTPKSEDAEAKKIIVGRPRSSVSNSIKSGPACDDFETHSADDSIIYRRHSSSSYSSSCMSPRRLSDVESGAVLQNAAHSSSKNLTHLDQDPVSKNSEKDVFMADIPSSDDIIKKSDCLSLKEKLNSKLSKGLNKRKREVKTEKPEKQRKLHTKTNKIDKNTSDVKNVTVSYEHNIAEICISSKGLYGTELLVELRQAFESINTRSDVAVTLLILASGNLSATNLDLKPLLMEDVETKTDYAFELTGAIRSLLQSVDQHCKVLVCGVEGPCEGVALAVVALSDLALASDDAVFTLGSAEALLLPCISVIAQRASHALTSELVLLGCRWSAGEARRRGLLQRTEWPHRLRPAARDLAAHLAAQPMQNVLLKKKLLKATRAPGSSLESNLSAEQDLVAEYWTSLDGQQLLRTHCEH